MISEQQKNNINQLPVDDLCTIVQECIEALGIVSVQEYSEIMCRNKRTVYDDLAKGKILCIEIGGTKYPCINANLK
jgi:hypothetical protein